jgi:uncharacterized membrane protein YdbT with pleckstrin-like domain
VVERITYTPELPYRAADRYLMPTERVVTTVRMHPAAIVKPALLILGGAILAGLMTWGAHGNGRLILAIWLLWVMLFLWQGWKIAIWWRRYFVVTENRLMLVTSLIFTDIAMMPLAKVTDMRLSESIFGRMLHYGEFIVESAGQEQALSDIKFVPYPSQIYQEILSLIFPGEPAATGSQGPRGRAQGTGAPSWPDNPLRGSGGGPPERPGDDPGF